MTPKHPHIEVQLSNQDGNAILILGRVKKAMREACVSEKEISRFYSEATASDYDHLLQTCMAWVNVI